MGTEQSRGTEGVRWTRQEETGDVSSRIYNGNRVNNGDVNSTVIGME